MRKQIELINKLKTFFDMQKRSTNHGSFNLQNATAQDLHEMIKSSNMPGFLSAQQRERIQQLYNSGSTFDAIRKMQGLIEAENGKQGKSFA